jgi:hypothetical protein
MKPGLSIGSARRRLRSRRAVYCRRDPTFKDDKAIRRNHNGGEVLRVLALEADLVLVHRTSPGERFLASIAAGPLKDRRAPYSVLSSRLDAIAP